MTDWKPIAHLLICPACRSKLACGPETFECAECRRVYPVVEGIPQLALFSDAAADMQGASGKSTLGYEQRYQDFERARSYNAKYDRELLKRLSTRREHRLLRALLGRFERCASLLEIPCGGGRISARLSPATELLIHADIGLGQVLFSKSKEGLAVPQIWMTASAFRIPFRDGGVDAAVCIRLSHHLTAPDQREQLLMELLRVSRRYVVFTFFDHDSIKNRLRLLRGKKSKLTMTLAQVTALAKAGGARLAACPWLSRLGSGHRYALMVK
jgi:uncharacterized protein YbaR (Trm112 family)/ubiquinone/menaquinone biosynthesis C-methylase UbiE